MTPTHATDHDDTAILPGIVLHDESPVADEHDVHRDGYGPDESDELDPVDADLLPSARRRIGKPTIALVAALVLGVGVLGGVYLDRHVGTTTTAATGFGGAGRAAAGARGFGGGEGFGGFGAAGGAAGAAGGEAGAAAGGTGAAATGAGNTAASPAVIGIVISWTSPTLVVQNLGGTTFTVTTTAKTTVTRPIGAADLAAGQTVSVVGTAGSGSTVTATAITISS